jgi:aminoglycoside 6-adenylyltransferase
MRNEQEMMDLILDFARKDERVRAVTMEGSRMNAKAPRDRFQDYDITFMVTDLDSYKAGDAWLEVFGRRIIMQKPDGMALFPPERGNRWSYLMLFEDGNRIDLTLVPIQEMESCFRSADSLTAVLLDKDKRCPPLAEPSDRDYWVKKPSREFADDCCNEFWWLSAYVVKGLCRDEFLYAQYHFELMRKQLLTMISWKAGFDTGFSFSAGKSYKYLNKYVSGDVWERIMKTCRVHSKDALWDSLLTACDLFRETAQAVCGALGCPHPPYTERVSAYIKLFIPDHLK